MTKLRVLVAVTLLLLAFCSTALGQVADGLVAFFPFSGNPDDASGNGNHGTAMNGVTLTSDRFGRNDSAYHFDGVDDYINVSDSSTLDITGSITIGAWIKAPPRYPVGAIVTKLGPDEINQTNGYCTYISNCAECPDQHRFLTQICYNWPESAGRAVSTTIVDDDEWHHVVSVYDGQLVTVYVDGESENSVAYSLGMLPNDMPLMIGLDPTPLEDRHFLGDLDDIRIYDRALSDDEIATLFHVVSAIPGAQPVTNGSIASSVHPNPFNPRTTISFELPKQTAVSLRVFDLSGRLVRVLVDGEIVAGGSNEAVWNGRDDSGRQVASGTYFYRLEAGEYSETRRMALIK
jgi:hypothetical protein